MHRRSEARCDDMYFNMKKGAEKEMGVGWGRGFLKVQQLSALRRRAAPFMLQSGPLHSYSFEGRLHLF